MSVILDTDRREVKVGSRTLRLPHRQFETLVKLAHANGQIVTRESLMENPGMDPRLVDQNIARIRRVLKVPCIQTTFKAGYSATGIKIVSTAKTYGAITHLDPDFCVATVRFDRSALPGLRIGGAVKLA